MKANVELDDDALRHGHHVLVLIHIGDALHDLQSAESHRLHGDEVPAPK